MKELVVISGKGGTGKTSVTAALAVLSGKFVMADCDVDAADLHLLLQPDIRQRMEFRSGHEAVIRAEDCMGCGRCLEACRFEAIRREGAVFCVEAVGCEGCGVCVQVCPVQAIDFPERVSGEWYLSATRCGPMVHARLNPGGENSGKLVALVREKARNLATEQGLDGVLVDGPPGIGCSVIASITGASLVLAVTEPTLSGLHDLERVLSLAGHFKIPAAVCVNKWDINAEQTEAIEQRAQQLGAFLAGRIRYGPEMTASQVAGRTVVEGDPSGAGADVKAVWAVLMKILKA